MASKHLGRVKYGKDDELEKLADQLLNNSAGENKRSVDRDMEKMSYERGFISSEDLKFYDPTNDWDTHESPTVAPISPDDIPYVSSTICSEVNDGNIRARNPELPKRRALMRHVDDEAGWGSTGEDIPLLGANDGPRKVCTKCKQAKGLQYFYSHPRTRDRLQSQCKSCQKS